MNAIRAWVISIMITLSGWVCSVDFCSHSLPSLPAQVCDHVINSQGDNFYECENR